MRRSDNYFRAPDDPGARVCLQITTRISDVAQPAMLRGFLRGKGI